MTIGGTTAGCPELVNRSGSSRFSHHERCGREIKGDGLCGIHLAAKRRREASHAEWEVKQRQGNDLLKEAARLSRILGVDVTADFDQRSRAYTGRFIVPGDWLRSAADRLVAADDIVRYSSDEGMDRWSDAEKLAAIRATIKRVSS